MLLSNRALSAQIVSTLETCLKDRPLPVPLHQPCFVGKEGEYVKDCIDTGWVSSVGSYVDRFEKKLAEYTGVKKAVAVVNGTAALHMALMLSGVTANDEVLIPTLTFVATANAVMYVNAVPHFVDSEFSTLGIDPQKLDHYLTDIGVIRSGVLYNRLTLRPIKALIGVHTFGHPFRLDEVAEVCRKHHLVLIEDAAESLGSFYDGKHTGNWGRISILSFNGNKIVTTGGGGAILTHDEALAGRVRHLTTTARIPHPYYFEHDEVGYNYRMPNLNAALGCAQLDSLDRFLNVKRDLAKSYEKAFQGISGLSFFKEPKGAHSNYWLNAVLLDVELSSARDEILKQTNDAGFGTRPCWTLMHKLPMFKNCPHMDLSIAGQIESRLINIPSGVPR